MKNLRLSALTLTAMTLIPITVTAQQSCPITIEHLDVSGRALGPVTIDFINKTDRNIKAAEFIVRFYNDTQENSGAIVVNAKGNTKPGEAGRAKDYTGFGPNKLEAVARNGAVAYVKAVKFEDGTKWKDDGSKVCRGKSDKFRGDFDKS
jgi:hypothetical protein